MGKPAWYFSCRFPFDTLAKLISSLRYRLATHLRLQWSLYPFGTSSLDSFDHWINVRSSTRWRRLLISGVDFPKWWLLCDFWVLLGSENLVIHPKTVGKQHKKTRVFVGCAISHPGIARSWPCDFYCFASVVDGFGGTFVGWCFSLTIGLNLSSVHHSHHVPSVGRVG